MVQEDLEAAYVPSGRIVVFLAPVKSVKECQVYSDGQTAKSLAYTELEIHRQTFRNVAECTYLSTKVGCNNRKGEILVAVQVVDAQVYSQGNA